MNKYSVIYLLLLSLFFPGCAGKLEEMPDATASGNGVSGIMTKIVNRPERSVPGMLLVCMDRADAIETGGISFSVDIRSVEKAFKATGKNAERLASCGLDKWYVIRFDEDVPLMDAAMSFAASDGVESVQFNNRAHLLDESYTVPVSAVPSVLPASPSAFDDPYLPAQWQYDNTGSTALAPTARAGADINVKDAWSLTGGDPDIIVAILDYGVKYTHPDLAANMWTNEAELNGVPGVDDDGNGYVDDIHGYNFYSDGAISWADEGDTGHGTHVAGTVAAANNNGIGVCGVAGGTGHGDGVRLMSCQTFEGGDGGNDLVDARAVVYAADNGASIIQASNGYFPGLITSDEEFLSECPLYASAIRYFLKYGGGNIDGKTGDVLTDGGILIYAAGNSMMDISAYPAAYKDIIGVTAIGPDYLPAIYTDYGKGCNIAAPGGDTSLGAGAATAILSTVLSEVSEDGSDYGYKQGTSMACPHVSGVAALGLSYARKLGKKFTREEFTSMLLTSVNDLEYYLDGEKGGMDLYLYRKQMGTGLVDAWKLLMQIEGTPCITVAAGKESLVDLSQYFGGAASSLDYTGVEIPEEAKTALGIEGEPGFRYGKLAITCTEYGSAKITVTADVEGMPVSRTVSIVARGAASSNGGWL